MKRKTHPRSHRMPWSGNEHRKMISLAKKKFTAQQIGEELGRTAPAIQQRLMVHGIALRQLKKAGSRRASV